MADPGVEILSVSINMPVLRMPGRRFPGVLVQGDTLSSLLALSRMAQERAQESGDAELVDLTAEMSSELSEFLREYERVLKARDLPLPYVSPFTD